MSNEFTFEPGYYEWHLRRNGDLYWVFGDILLDDVTEYKEETGQEELTKEDFEDIIRGELNVINLVMDSDNLSEIPMEVLKNWTDKEWELPTEHEEQDILQAMCEGYVAQYGTFWNEDERTRC